MSQKNRKTFRVDVFTSENKQVVEMDLEDQLLTFADVKRAVGQIVGLKTESLSIFGIFKVFPGMYRPPVELCFDKDLVPKGLSNLALLRLCFNKDEEIKILNQDKFALALIFWEVRYMHYHGVFSGEHEEIARLILRVRRCVLQDSTDLFRKRTISQLESRRLKIVPVHEQEVVNKLDKMQEILKSILEEQILRDGALIRIGIDISLSNIESYMEVMHSLSLYYWSYYYKVLDCTLYGDNAPLLAAYLNLNKEHSIVIVLNRTCLSFTGKTASGMIIQLVDFPWCNIRCIMKTSRIFSFQILVNDQNEHKSYMTISIHTKHCDYLYSLAVHILGIHSEVLTGINTNNFFPPTDEELEGIESIIPTTNKELKIRIMNFLSLVTLSPPLIEDFPQPPADTGLNQDSMILNTFYVATVVDLKKVLFYNTSNVLAGHKGELQRMPVLLSYSTHADGKFYMPLASDGHHLQIPHKVSSKKITIHAFWKGPYQVSLSSSSGYMTVGGFKKLVAKSLQIKQSSLDIFGLFLCSHKSPLLITWKLCLDTEPLPDVSQFSFRRLSFSKRQERRICERDNQALKFIWSEAKFMLDKNLMLPRPIPKTAENLVSLSRQGSSRTHFMEYFGKTSQYWWNFYYKADKSTLSTGEVEKSTLPTCEADGINFPTGEADESYSPTCEAEVSNLSTDEKLSDTIQSHVAINAEFLFLLDYSAENYIKVPLDYVRCVMVEKNRCPIMSRKLICETLLVKKLRDEPYENILDCVAINTVNHEYFFSISRYIFTSLKSRQAKHVYSDKVINPIFKGPGHVLLPAALQVVNKTF